MSELIVALTPASTETEVPIIVSVEPVTTYPSDLKEMPPTDCADESVTVAAVPKKTAVPPAAHARSLVPLNHLADASQFPLPPRPAPVTVLLLAAFWSLSQ